MTPSDKQQLKSHLKAVAKILYRNTEPTDLKSFESIEKSLRQKMFSGGDKRPRTVIGKALRASDPPQKFLLIDKIISRRKRVPSCDKKEGPH